MAFQIGSGSAVFARVDAAHRALQLGELEHHVGDEIGLREPAGRRGVLRVARAPKTSAAIVRRASRCARPCRDSCRASCGKTIVCRRSSAILELDLAVRLPEELRVAQSRRDDALGVLRDQALVRRLRVDHREERLLQLAGVVHHREVVLMMHERGGQDFVRKLQELALEEPGDDAGEFDEVGDLVDSAACVAQVDARRPASAPWPPARARCDRGAPHGRG